MVWRLSSGEAERQSSSLQVTNRKDFLSVLESSPTALVHVTGGAVSLIAGPISLLAPKGRWLHRKAGTVFFVAMLVMASIAFVMASMRVEKVNTLAAAFTLYLVATAWGVVKTRPGTVGRIERIAPWAAALIAAGGLTIGGLVAAFPGLLYDGDPDFSASPVLFLVFGGLATMSAGLDIWTLRRGGLTGAGRVSRHLWRMCLALFIAAGSYFLGQADTIPASLRGDHLYLPPLLVLVALVFWIARVRIGPRYRSA
jgi:uncharacterized membrane protein